MTAAGSLICSRKWLKSTRLAVLSTDVPAQVTAQLVASKWPKLTELSITNSQLDTAAVTRLVSTVGPQFRNLTLHRNQLDSEAVMHLLEADWPLLEHLNLESNPILDVPFTPTQTNWPSLTSLNLSGIKMNSRKSLADALAAQLHQLHHGMHRGADDLAVSELASRPWRQLHTLYLWRGIVIRGSANTQQGRSAQFTHLYLQHNKLNAAAARHLVKAEWPDLASLNLSGNCLDAAAMKHLVKGKWPNMCMLQLHVNALGAEGVNIFTKARWTYLQCLTLDPRDMCHAAFTALHVCAGDMPKMAGCTKRKKVTESRDLPVPGTAETAVWQHLKEVVLVPFTNCEVRERLVIFTSASQCLESAKCTG